MSDMGRIHRLLPKRFHIRLWWIFMLQTLTAIAESSTIVVISLFCYTLASPDSLRSSFSFQYIMPYLPDYAVFRLRGDRTFITLMGLMVVVFIATKNLIAWLTMARALAFSERLSAFISVETFSRYFTRDYYWHISDESAVVLSNLNGRVHLTGLTTALLQFICYFICCVVMFATLMIVQPILTLVVLLSMIAVAGTAYHLLHGTVERTGNELSILSSQEYRAVNMATRGMREIIIYRKQDTFLDSIRTCLDSSVRPRVFLGVSSAIPPWFLEMAGFADIFAVMFYQVYTGVPMPVVVSSATMLLLAAWRVLPSVNRCMALLVQIRGIRPQAMSCLELMEGFTSQAVEERPQPDPDFRFDYAIDLDKACFRYPSAGENCLSDVSIRVEKGESIGIVGSSGAGKTTLALMLAGLFRPQVGEMRVDGANLTPERLEAYREKVGLVPQNPLLLPGTLAENVALSRWGEPIDRDKVAALCRTMAMDFVETNPAGIDYVIGEGGQGLSGGQMQRVTIARALYSDPEILILDEATSAMDMFNENLIADTVRNMKGRLTTIVVAHRLSTVEHCDRILWFENGRLLEVDVPGIVLPKYLGALAAKAQ